MMVMLFILVRSLINYKWVSIDYDSYWIGLMTDILQWNSITFVKGNLRTFGMSLGQELWKDQRNAASIIYQIF